MEFTFVSPNKFYNSLASFKRISRTTDMSYFFALQMILIIFGWELNICINVCIFSNFLSRKK